MDRSVRIRWVIAAALCVMPACAYDFDAAFTGRVEDAGATDDVSAAGSGGSAGAGVGGSAGAAAGGNAGAAGQDAGDAPDAAQEAEAAAPVVSPLKQVLHGTAQLAGSNDTVELQIPIADPARSFLVFGARFEGGTPASSMVTGNLTDTSKLVFARVGGVTPSLDVQIVWHVAEFSDGVSVQRGAVPLGSSTPAKINLSKPVDRSKSFPLVTFRNTGSYYGSDDLARIDFASDSEVHLSRAAPNTPAVAEWQVITIEGCHVQSGHVGLTASQTTSSAVVAGIDPSNTLLLLSYSFSYPDTSAPTESAFVRGSVTPGLLSFARGGSTGDIDATWYAVTFDNGSVVHSGERVFAPTMSSSAVDAPALDATRAVALSSGLWERSGSTSFSGMQPGLATYTFGLQTPGQLDIMRGTIGAPSSVSWSVIQFAR